MEYERNREKEKKSLRKKKRYVQKKILMDTPCESSTQIKNNTSK